MANLGRLAEGVFLWLQPQLQRRSWPHFLRVECDGRLLQPSCMGIRGRRPAAICASTGRMKGDERGNREISGLRPASAALAPRSQRPAAICAGTWRTKGEERGDLRNFRPHAYAADQRAVLARSGRWMQLRLCVRLQRRAYGPRQEKASG